MMRDPWVITYAVIGSSLCAIMAGDKEICSNRNVAMAGGAGKAVEVIQRFTTP